MIDLVCGMDISAFDGVVTATHRGETFHFCGSFCRQRFQNNPERFRGTPLINLTQVRKNFQLGAVEIKVLQGLNLHVWEGDFLAIVGASGSGKSTALNMIGLLDQPSGGKILLKGKDVSLLTEDVKAELRAQTFGFVFQQYNLIPWLTAYENIVLPLIFSRRTTDAKELNALIAEVNLKERVNHRPLELSGGEQQRVALLRALVNDPTIILADEPTGNLDSVTGNKILDMLIHLHKEHKKTLIVVTHDADIAEKADQVIALKDGRQIQDHHSQKKIYTE